MLAQGKQERHKGVSLFSPLPFVHGVCLSKIILPQVRTRLAMEHLHERHNRTPAGASPPNILSREMKSKAPTPSMDKMVASECCSVRACTACATHSHPAFVVSAQWNGAVAASTASPATTLLITSPATMPLTPPDGFCKAVSLPVLTMSLMELDRSSRGVQTQRRVI